MHLARFPRRRLGHPAQWRTTRVEPPFGRNICFSARLNDRPHSVTSIASTRNAHWRTLPAAELFDATYNERQVTVTPIFHKARLIPDVKGNFHHDVRLLAWWSHHEERHLLFGGLIFSFAPRRLSDVAQAPRPSSNHGGCIRQVAALNAEDSVTMGICNVCLPSAFSWRAYFRSHLDIAI
jgi:hypothetical protein